MKTSDVKETSAPLFARSHRRRSAFALYAIQSLLLQTFLVPTDLIIQIYNLAPCRFELFTILLAGLVAAIAISFPGIYAIRLTLEAKSLKKFRLWEATVLWLALVASISAGSLAKVLCLRGDKFRLSIVSYPDLVHSLQLFTAISLVAFPSALVLATSIKWLSPTIIRLDYIRLRSLTTSLRGLLLPDTSFSRLSNSQQAMLLTSTFDGVEAEIHNLLAVEDDIASTKCIHELLNAIVTLRYCVHSLVDGNYYHDLRRLLPGGKPAGVVQLIHLEASDTIRRLGLEFSLD